MLSNDICMELDDRIYDLIKDINNILETKEQKNNNKLDRWIAKQFIKTLNTSDADDFTDKKYINHKYLLFKEYKYDTRLMYLESSVDSISYLIRNMLKEYYEYDVYRNNEECIKKVFIYNVYNKFVEKYGKNIEYKTVYYDEDIQMLEKIGCKEDWL